MRKREILVLLVVASLGFTAFGAFSSEKKTDKRVNSPAEDAYSPIVVLELFTSQGCSSCPAADVLLNKVKKMSEKNVFTLSYHVDYWNSIGWKDPFSMPQYAVKQRLYNEKFRNRSNYTPQIIVNGKEHFGGSNSTKMNTKIATYKKQKVENQLEISNIHEKQGTIYFDYEVLGGIEDKALRAVLVLDEKTTSVMRGENKNRTLTNSNIVVAEKVNGLDTQKGKMTLALPQKVNGSDTIQLIVLVENIRYDITAATQRRLAR